MLSACTPSTCWAIPSGDASSSCWPTARRRRATSSTSIRAEFGISQPAVSQHLRVLREAGFAVVRADGRRRLYAVQPDALREVDDWVDRFRRFWEPPLDALATELVRGRREAAARRPPSAHDRVRHPLQRRESTMIDVTHQISTIDRRSAPARCPPARPAPSRSARSTTARSTTCGTPAPTPSASPAGSCRSTGDLKVGGHYQLEGNASGTVEAATRPTGFDATWEFGGEVSWIELRLAPEGDDRTRFELTHIAHVDDERWAQFGPGAVGIGWDLRADRPHPAPGRRGASRSTRPRSPPGRRRDDGAPLHDGVGEGVGRGAPRVGARPGRRRRASRPPARSGSTRRRRGRRARLTRPTAFPSRFVRRTGGPEPCGRGSSPGSVERPAGGAPGLDGLQRGRPPRA